MGNYLYNGIELPALPEWDRETYPYAVLGDHGAYGIKGTITLCVSISAPYIDSLGDTSHPVGETYMYVYLNMDTYTWREWQTFENPSLDVLLWGSPIWANVDILNTDGTLYLAASDPIPVTAAEPIDHASMLMGWMVGRRIAGQRGK